MHFPIPTNPFALFDRAVPAGFSVDISETDDNYVLRAELPGVEKDNVAVDINDGVITVSAEFAAAKDGRQLRAERVSGKVRRSFVLPVDAAPDKIAAQMTNGILALTVPKAEDAKTRRINIQ
ncbi:MAG: Hsp20/alpha crystallin family protein [Gammaproteobacteria bacterium]